MFQLAKSGYARGLGQALFRSTGKARPPAKIPAIFSKAVVLILVATRYAGWSNALSAVKRPACVNGAAANRSAGTPCLESARA